MMNQPKFLIGANIPSIYVHLEQDKGGNVAICYNGIRVACVVPSGRIVRTVIEEDDYQLLKSLGVYMHAGTNRILSEDNPDRDVY